MPTYIKDPIQIPEAVYRGDYFESFVDPEACDMGLIIQDIRNWRLPKKVGGGREKARIG